MEKASHVIKLLKKLLAGEIVTSSDHFASNSNQYFGTIKKHGIELVEVWRPNLKNAGRHKERSLHQRINNLQIAKKYLEDLQGIKPKQDEKQESRY